MTKLENGEILHIERSSELEIIKVPEVLFDRKTNKKLMLLYDRIPDLTSTLLTVESKLISKIKHEILREDHTNKMSFI